ncbi:methyltransferase domain-containing protein [Streptomyces sp. NPDC059479]|uniref:methyltransferase domain-containing protein n=1 Tax=Streptomyces sp. NPDC059479 TaxID=3346848 RepID=UPI0036CDA41D
MKRLIDGAQPYMAALTATLEQDGAIRTRPWAKAFSSVPRHVFVPRWYAQETNDRGIAVWRMQVALDQGRLAEVYRDETLVTALDPDTAKKVDEWAWTGVATSSSTMPSLMAGMLEDLCVQDGHRVLEVGTGTGYNAALLCARLGDQLVHSVDIDPALVRAARERLASIGYVPQLAAADGQLGYPDDYQFDRIIATCSVPRIPEAWIEQTRPGGFILTDLVTGIEGGLVRLAVDDDGAARGGFTANSGRFMPARVSTTTYPRPEREPYAPETDERPTTVTAADIRTHYPFRLLLGFTLPTADLVYHLDDDGTMAVQLQTPDGTWARTPVAEQPGGATVTYGGPPDLWEQVEAAWVWWNERGRPDQTLFGLTREAGREMYVRFGPDGRCWELGA